jgi:hypothetical protein
VIRRVASAVMLVLAALLVAAPASPQSADTPEARRAAALKYLAAVPTQTMLDDMIASVARQVPEEKRQQFTTLMRKVLRTDALNAITLDLLVKHFTVGEIDALTRFYGSPEGASVMKKFGVYAGDLLPQIQAEVVRAIKEVRAEMQI